MAKMIEEEYCDAIVQKYTWQGICLILDEAFDFKEASPHYSEALHEQHIKAQGGIAWPRLWCHLVSKLCTRDHGANMT